MARGAYRATVHGIKETHTTEDPLEPISPRTLRNNCKNNFQSILGERLPTSVFWPGEFHALYSPWGHKDSDTTEQLSHHLTCLNWEIQVQICLVINDKMSETAKNSLLIMKCQYRAFFVTFNVLV